MCANGHHSRENHPSLGSFITNWNQPLPLRTKVRLTVKNMWIRLSTRSNCCGNHGEPGC